MPKQAQSIKERVEEYKEKKKDKKEVAEKKAAQERKIVEEVILETKPAGEWRVIDPYHGFRFIRSYTLEAHGKHAKELAYMFAEKKGYDVYEVKK